MSALGVDCKRKEITIRKRIVWIRIYNPENKGKIIHNEKINNSKKQQWPHTDGPTTRCTDALLTL